MLGRIIIFWGCMFLLGGCVYDDEPMPEIVQRPAPEPLIVQPGKKVIKPLPTPKQANKDFTSDIPGSWLPPPGREKNWTAIVIHHSGTENGSAAIFDRWHREGNDWKGIGYDFVIGNGSNSGDGQVEVTFRWRQQITGAHCRTPHNWANRDAIGICLVGNFNHTTPTSRQMRSLMKLIRFLQRRYKIPTSRIYGHNTTPGARVTDCPGKNFPLARLKSML